MGEYWTKEEISRLPVGRNIPYHEEFKYDEYGRYERGKSAARSRKRSMSYACPYCDTWIPRCITPTVGRCPECDKFSVEPELEN